MSTRRNRPTPGTRRVASLRGRLRPGGGISGNGEFEVRNGLLGNATAARGRRRGAAVMVASGLLVFVMTGCESSATDPTGSGAASRTTGASASKAASADPSLSELPRDPADAAATASVRDVILVNDGTFGNVGLTAPQRACMAPLFVAQAGRRLMKNTSLLNASWQWAGDDQFSDRNPRARPVLIAYIDAFTECVTHDPFVTMEAYLGGGYDHTEWPWAACMHSHGADPSLAAEEWADSYMNGREPIVQAGRSTQFPAAGKACWRSAT